MPSRFCTQCGTEIDAGQRFCPECGTPAQPPAEGTQPSPVQPGAASISGQRRPPLALLLGIGGVAIALVLVVIYWATARPPAIVGDFPPIHNEEGYPFPDVPRITVQEAKARFDAGNVIFVDVRSEGQYNAERIPGAILVPINEFETRYREVPQNTEIITYCT